MSSISILKGMSQSGGRQPERNLVMKGKEEEKLCADASCMLVAYSRPYFLLFLLLSITPKLHVPGTVLGVEAERGSVLGVEAVEPE